MKDEGHREFIWVSLEKSIIRLEYNNNAACTDHKCRRMQTVHMLPCLQHCNASVFSL